MDVLTLLYSQVETSTTPVGGAQVGEAIYSVIQAASTGVAAAFVAAFAAVFVISRFRPITRLEATKFDWVPWALRAVSVIGGAVAAAFLVPAESMWTAVGAELMVAAPLALRYIQRTVEEATD